MLARISKFRCFHETKQTQMRLEGFSTTWLNLFLNTFAVGEFWRLLQSSG